MKDAIIRAEALRFSYTSAEGVAPVVLDGVDLTIREGSFVAILGHNGSGKSTLAKHFNAILLPSGGKVYVDGMDTADEALLLDIRRQVGMVFQNPDNQIVASVVEEDVAFAPENLGVPPAEIRQRVDAALRAGGMPATLLTSFPVGRSNGWPSPGCWPCAPGAWCWTSPPPCWTRWAGRRSCLPCGN